MEGNLQTFFFYAKVEPRTQMGWWSGNVERRPRKHAKDCCSSSGGLLVEVVTLPLKFPTRQYVCTLALQ